MITRKQYDEALSICKQYKQQLINEIESVSTQMRESDIYATIGDLKYKGKGISTRLMNHLYTFNAIHKIANSWDFDNVNLSELLKFNKEDFFKVRTFGKKSFEELQSVMNKNGFEIKD